MSRRQARELALKILYRYEEGDSDLPGIIRVMLEGEQYKVDVRVFCQHVVERTVEHVREIDGKIIAVLANWPFDRISVIDKIILRMGTCEMLFFDDIPPQVSINEAIELAKAFGGKDSGRFVNGILDAIKEKHESSDHQ